MTEEERKEKRRGYARADYQRHKERYKANAKKWAESHRERRREIGNKWGENHPEKKRELSREYYEANKERIAVIHKIYLENNPVIRKERNKRRRARKRTGIIERFNSIEIYERDRWICQLCKKRVNKRLSYPHPYSASLDHIIPLSKGGNHTRANVHLAHLTCNKKAFTGGIKQLLLFGGVDKKNPRIELEISGC